MIRQAIFTAAFWTINMANAPAAAEDFSHRDRGPDLRVTEDCRSDWRDDAACRHDRRDDRFERIRVSYPTYAGPSYAFFAAPALNGSAVNSCLDGRLMSCGAPAADAFCQRAGFYKARSFATAMGRGPTRHADSGRKDEDSRRGSLSSVMCVI